MRRTSAERCGVAALGLSLALVVSAVDAAEEAAPDLEFLEYLGTWDADEDWTMFVDEVRKDSADESQAQEPVAAKDDSTEQENES